MDKGWVKNKKVVAASSGGDDGVGGGTFRRSRDEKLATIKRSTILLRELCGRDERYGETGDVKGRCQRKRAE